MSNIIGKEMLLGMQVLLDNLEDDFVISYFNKRHDEYNLKGVSIYYGQEDLSENLVYVADAQTFIQNPITRAGISIAAVGEQSIVQSVPFCSVIQILDVSRWEIIFEEIRKIFMRYQDWARQLQQIIDMDGGLYELCLAAIDFFNNPVYIHDEHFNILSMPMWVVGMTEVLVDEGSNSKMFHLDKIRQLRSNKAYIHTLIEHGARLWNPAYNSHRVLYINLWLNDQKYAGRFLINELNSSLKPSDFAMAEYIQEYLLIALEREIDRKSQSVTIENVLSQMIQGEQLEESYVRNRLQMISWKAEDSYICFQIQQNTDKEELISALAISSMMGMVLKKTFSFAFEGKAYTLCNAVDSPERIEECIEKLQDFANKYNLLVGQSNVFNDFFQHPVYFKQAEAAITAMKWKDKNKTYAKFSDSVLIYMLYLLQQEFPDITACLPEIRRLKELDDTKNTDYLMTLKAYLHNGCQQTATASELFIHRSTLVYRLERIQEIMQLDFTDPNLRVYMRLSLMLLEAESA